MTPPEITFCSSIMRLPQSNVTSRIIEGSRISDSHAALDPKAISSVSISGEPRFLRNRAERVSVCVSTSRAILIFHSRPTKKYNFMDSLKTWTVLALSICLFDYFARFVDSATVYFQRKIVRSEIRRKLINRFLCGKLWVLPAFFGCQRWVGVLRATRCLKFWVKCDICWCWLLIKIA